jgi:hypothetical protein
MGHDVVDGLLAQSRPDARIGRSSHKFSLAELLKRVLH